MSDRKQIIQDYKLKKVGFSTYLITFKFTQDGNIKF